MTQALAGGGAMAPAAPRLTAWRLLTLVASAGIFLIYSQFWVFPLLGDAGNPAASGLIRAMGSDRKRSKDWKRPDSDPLPMPHLSSRRCPGKVV